MEIEHTELKEIADALKTADYFSLSKAHKISLLRVTCEELSCTFEMHNLVDMHVGQLSSVRNERKELRKTTEEEKRNNDGAISKKLLVKEDNLNNQENTFSNSIRMAILGFDRK